MRPDQIKEQVKELTLSEKLILVEDIWDLIAADNLEIPVSAWQKEKLDKRYKEYKEGSLKLHEWEQVHKELREKHK